MTAASVPAPAALTGTLPAGAPEGTLAASVGAGAGAGAGGGRKRFGVGALLAGAAIMQVIAAGCTILGLSNPIQDVVVGLVIVTAVAIDTIRQHRLTAIAAIKRCVHEGSQKTLDDGLALEAELMERLFRSKDASEGLHAFVDKRTPQFVGS